MNLLKVNISTEFFPKQSLVDFLEIERNSQDNLPR